MTGKLSPHYRNDSADGLPTVLKTYLDRHFFEQLPNRDARNPKLLVVYSGGNAVGKSTISHLIEREYNGLVLSNDEMKYRIVDYDNAVTKDQLNKLTWQYSMDLYQRLGELTDNGLVVRDGIIDWYYDRILPVFKDQGYQLFIIGFDLSREKRIELIKARGDMPTVSAERLIALLEDHAIHIDRFRKHYTPDIMLNDKTIFDHQLVLEALQTKLSALS